MQPCPSKNLFGLKVDGTNSATLMRKIPGADFMKIRHIGVTEDISICVLLLCKRGIFLSFTMDCEKCNWTSVEKQIELWRDASQLVGN